MTKKTRPTDEDIARRAFSPIKTDLVERLTREADDRTGHLPCAAQDKSSAANKLAA